MSIMYHIVINKHEFENNTMYLDNKSGMYLHLNGHTKWSHYYRDEATI